MKFSTALLFFCLAAQSIVAQFKYISPLPGSALHYPETNIILKNGNMIDKSSISNKNLFTVSGSISGNHSWTARLSVDNKTVTIQPHPDFAYGETVYVTVYPGLKKLSGESIEGVSFSFQIRNQLTGEERKRFFIANLQSLTDDPENNQAFKNFKKNFQVRDSSIYPLDSMPTFRINVNNNPAPGQIFYANHQDQDILGHLGTNSFNTIINNDGSIVWARDVGSGGRDFKLNVNGYLTYFVNDRAIYLVLDSNYNVIDSVQCGNGLEMATNNHEFMMYPDGHSFLLAYDNVTTDMTAYGGLPDAVVQFPVIQEIDQNHEVVFEWRTMDHFQITDADKYVSLANALIDFAHTNSIEKDSDNNLLISNRNMDELTKIDHETGDIIWRMNGENNQFTFVNDNIPEHFSNQHDLRRLANGNITLFNNGNHLVPLISSAKEYALDQVNKVASLIWHYEHPDVNGYHVYGSATGSTQRLPDGNTMIDWGLIYNNVGLPNQTEIDSNNNIVWEMTFDSSGEKSYRVHKYVWDPCSRITGYTMHSFPDTLQTTLSWGAGTGGESYIVEYRPVGAQTWTATTTDSNSVILTGLMPVTDYEWRVTTVCSDSPYVSSAASQSDTFTTPVATQISFFNRTSVLIFPDPATDQINVEIRNTTKMAAHVSVVNMMGTIMYTNKYPDLNNGSAWTINIQSLPAGSYLLKITDGYNTTIQKFLKN
ncbi:MAG: aryl-sulfate sulfotransferase [Chitinophagales bacterium]|nr:aryl-sulfate sulfotransferase [Chitinophagales bacterium]